MEKLINIFQRRDGLSLEEAQDLLDEMKQDVASGCDPEEVLYDQGLEPDYIFELIDL